MWSQFKTQKSGLRPWEIGLRTEACVYFTIGLLILAGLPSAALELNGKGIGSILNEGKGNISEDKGNIAEGKGNIVEIEFKNLCILIQTRKEVNFGKPKFAYPCSYSY